jgi:4-hydroxybenzoate polyprenyltransferase
MNFSKLFNIPALVLLAVCMFIFRYGFLTQQPGFVPALNEWQYALLVLSSVLIAAGGFLMNNAFGYGREDKQPISEAKGYNIYLALNITGVGIGYYIANLAERPMFTGIFIVAAATLYIYATSLKQTIVVSNIILALVITLPVIGIGIFNIYYALIEENRAYTATLFDLLLDYSIFTFVIALLLTFINDLATTDADYNAGINTLPIALGRTRTIKIVLAFTLLPVAMLVYYGQEYIINLTYALGFGILFLLGPLVYFIIKLWNAATQKDFRHLEKVLQLLLLFTALSIAAITYNININIKKNAEEKTEQIQANTGIRIATQAAVSA